MNEQWCSTIPGGVRIAVRITPNARKSEIIGIQDHALKIKLQAQPIEGKANDALIRFIADKLAIPQRALTITHGLTGKQKLLELKSPGLTPEAVVLALLPP